MSASVHATPRGSDYYDGHGREMEIELVDDGVEVLVENGTDRCRITIPDDVWVMFCQRFVRGQDGNRLRFKDRTILFDRERGEIA